MRDFAEANVICPHCGHHIRLTLDASGGDQDYVEDCPVCCNAIHLRLHRDELGDKLQLFIDADDEQIY